MPSIQEIFSKTAVQTSGLQWTLFEHGLALFYIPLLLQFSFHITKSGQPNVKKNSIISLILVCISLATELYLPLGYTFVAFIIFFCVSALLIGQFYSLNFKRTGKTTIVFFAFVFVVNIFLGIVKALVRF